MNMEMTDMNRIEVGDEFTVDILVSERNGSLITRINGIVTFLEVGSDVVAPASTWVVRIIEIHKAFMKAETLVKIRTARQNLLLLQEKIKQFEKLKQPHKRKEAPKYQYKTKNQL